jgi:predicted nucleotidyltransferase
MASSAPRVPEATRAETGRLGYSHHGTHVSARTESIGRRIAATGIQLNSAEAAEVGRSIDRIVEALQPEKVYVFGSRARGDAASDSDLDLFVVVSDTQVPAYRLDQIAYQSIGPHLTPIDIIVATREEFERRARAPSSLPATVLREGTLVYAA